MARVAELELALAKATKDSSTSSKPPSSDITKPKTPKKPGRCGKPKRGGPPGHQQHLRENLPPERVDETFDYEMTDEDVQRLELTPTDEFETYQFIELPESVQALHGIDFGFAGYELPGTEGCDPSAGTARQR